MFWAVRSNSVPTFKATLIQFGVLFTLQTVLIIVAMIPSKTHLRLFGRATEERSDDVFAVLAAQQLMLVFTAIIVVCLVSRHVETTTTTTTYHTKTWDLWNVHPRFIYLSTGVALYGFILFVVQTIVICVALTTPSLDYRDMLTAIAILQTNLLITVLVVIEMASRMITNFSQTQQECSNSVPLLKKSKPIIEGPEDLPQRPSLVV